MYLSTEEYLHALRQGDYLSALEWLEFLIGRYASSQSEVDADTTLQIAVFELINHGFSQQDLPLIQVLYALLYDAEPPFIGKIAYSGTVLCNAALQYMVYSEHELIPFYLCSESLNIDAVKEWMQRDNKKLDSGRNSDELMKKYTRMHQLLSSSQKTAKIVREKIICISNYQFYIENYVAELTKFENKGELAAMRLGVASALQNFLKDKTILTSEIAELMTVFINKIREMQPFDWEEDFLSKMLPKPFVKWLLDSSAQKFRFFAIQVINELLPAFDRSEKKPSNNI